MSWRGAKSLVVLNESSSNPSATPYETVFWSNGDITCNCRGWVFARKGRDRGCKHTDALARQIQLSRQATTPVPTVEIPAEATAAQREATIAVVRSGRKFRFVIEAA